MHGACVTSFSGWQVGKIQKHDETRRMTGWNHMQVFAARTSFFNFDVGNPWSASPIGHNDLLAMSRFCRKGVQFYKFLGLCTAANPCSFLLPTAASLSEHVLIPIDIS